MWEDGVYLAVKATMGEIIVWNRNGVWLASTVWRKTERERWERSDLEMSVAVPWRKTKDDAKMGGERLKRRSRDDGHGLQSEAGDGRTRSGTEERDMAPEDLEEFGVQMFWVLLVAQKSR